MKKDDFSSDNCLPKLTPRLAITEASIKINEPKAILFKSYINLKKFPRLETKNNRKEIYKTLDLIHKLNIENKVEEVYKEEAIMKQKREKINDNKEIREKRLGIFKKKDIPLEEEKAEENKIKIMNEKFLEKYGMKEKERITEKKYKFNLKELDKIEKKLEEVTKQIKEIVFKIENNKMEINVINKYGETIDKKQVISEEPIKRIEKKQSTKMFKPFIKKDFSQRRSSVMKVLNVEKECKFIVKRYQRDEKHKKIINKVNKDIGKLESLQKLYEQLKEKDLNIKKDITNLKTELVNIYHITLYEGLDFRNYGLATFILNIWNLGMNVDINFFPTYLDKQSIDYLFDKSRKILYYEKLKKLIQETELDYIDSFNQWKEEESVNSKSNSSNIDHNFFKTKILEQDLFYEQYPKSKLFIMNYNKKHENESNKVGNIKANSISFKNIKIPKYITDKNKKKEKLQYLLKLHKNQMQNDEKNEIFRIAKEFLYNDYEKKYQVCIETIIGALCGEKSKDQQLNFFYKFKKEYNDNLKKIAFFTKLKKNIHK